MGTTGLGAVDSLPDILELQAEYGFRIHADAAYGGYFGLASRLGEAARAAFDALGEVDSVVIDPHKHGLQPYGCGSIIYRDPSVGRFYQHGSPYTYFSSSELHLGEISLECSRPGAAAVALWATMELLPLERGGEFAGMLDRCIEAARLFHGDLESTENYVPVHTPDLDIVVYACNAASASEASDRARAIFEAAAAENLHLALMKLPLPMVQAALPDLAANSETVTCLRSTFMKPEQLDWVPEIISILNSVAETA
jgi:glutamate/tyrosine decarboxylase-like PLP-dependent enzyme